MREEESPRVAPWRPSSRAKGEVVNLMSNAITAVVTLVAVTLGGWLSVRTQDRSWRRDHARQWRDIRLSAYKNFLSAYREYIAFTLDPTAKIVSIPHPQLTGDLMPFFDENGRAYKERLEATKTALRLVSELPMTVRGAENLVRRARRIASARATHAIGEISHEEFQELWAAERAFVASARQELGLPEIATDEVVK